MTNTAKVRGANCRPWLRLLAVGMNHQHAIGQHEVARLKSARKRARDSSPDYQVRLRHRIESTPRRFGCALVTDAMGNDREILTADLRAKAMQAVERQRSARDAPLERRDLALEGIEEKNQTRGLISILRSTRLSEPLDASKIVSVIFTARGPAA